MAWFRWSRVLGIVLLGVAVAAVLLVRASDEPRPWSTEQAADEYVAMAAPMTADLDALAALGSDATITDWVAVCRRLTTSTAAYIEALDGGAWDPALRALRGRRDRDRAQHPGVVRRVHDGHLDGGAG